MFSLVRSGAVALFLALLLAMAVACGDDGDDGTAAGTSTPTAVVAAAVQQPLTLTDGMGRSVTLPAAPQRIASLSPAATEILFAVGAGDQVAAVDKYSNYPPEAASREQLDAFEPSVEAIAGAQPDLVFVVYDPGNLVDGLTNAGLTVFFLETPTSVEGVLDQIRMLGQATGHAQEAEGLVATMEQGIADIEEKLADVEQGPRVFHEVDNQLYTVAPSLIRREPVYDPEGPEHRRRQRPGLSPALAGGHHRGGPGGDHPRGRRGGESADTVKARPGWGSISAVQSNRIYVIDPDIVSRPGPRLVDALQTLAQMLYPERFE